MNINDMIIHYDWPPYYRDATSTDSPLDRFYTTSWDNRWLYTPMITLDTLTVSWPNEFKSVSSEFDEGSDIVPADLKEVL